jgi:hypothetical protein
MFLRIVILNSIFLNRRKNRFTFKRKLVTRTYLKQDHRIDKRQNRGVEDGQSPVGGDRVQHGDAQVTGVIEQVEHGGERAAEFGLAHFAAVRQREAGHETRVEAHQCRAGVQSGRTVGQHQRGHGQQMRDVGHRHARPVTETVLHEGYDHAAHRRE